MLSRPWPRRLTPDRARPWFGEPPPRCLTSCYDRLRQTLRRPLELGQFLTIRPVPYPGRTPHIHFAVSGRGFARFITQMYVAGESGNDTGPALSRRGSARGGDS